MSRRVHGLTAIRVLENVLDARAVGDRLWSDTVVEAGPGNEPIDASGVEGVSTLTHRHLRLYAPGDSVEARLGNRSDCDFGLSSQSVRIPKLGGWGVPAHQSRTAEAVRTVGGPTRVAAE